MSYAKTAYKRSNAEIIFIFLFLPLIFIGYSIVKFPEWFVSLNLVTTPSAFYLLGKSPSFWYNLFYTGIVCYLSGKVLLQNKSPYKRGKKPALSSYQRNKFLSIFVIQLGIFFLLPFVISPLINGQSLLVDPVVTPKREAYVYISTGFKSVGGLFYVLVLVPLSVYFFGKRYCAWFCACGNLAETIGITKWGAAWVKYKTPTGKMADKMESLQTAFMAFGFAYGILLFFDIFKIFSAPDLLMAGKAFQDFAIDFMFGAIIGIGAYPFFGTRIWCRYGCPLAKMMEIFGRHIKTKFQVAANDACKGLNLCSQVCPMGIDVAAYAHKDKKPINGSFGLENTPCIGCGGCIDICPVDALKFS